MRPLGLAIFNEESTKELKHTSTAVFLSTGSDSRRIYKRIETYVCKV